MASAAQGTLADADGLPPGTFPAGYAFHWVRVKGGSETDVPGARMSTYRPVPADVGGTLKVRVSFLCAGGNPETRTSAARAAVRR